MKVYIVGKKGLFIFFGALTIIFLSVFFMPRDNQDIKVNTRAKRDLPIYCVETDKPQISISFDAAWGADDTDEILAALEKHNVKTTFFLVGYWVDKYPEEVKKIYEAGHDIGNHSATHPQMDKLSRGEIKEELMIAHKKVKDLLGIDMDLYRPPYGAYNDDVVDVARQCGYYTIQWDVDSLDWKEYGRQQMIDRVINHKNLGNGSIILFHNNAKYTAESLDAILTGLKEKGYEIVPLSELIMRENFYIDHTGRQCRDENSDSNDNIDPLVENEEK